MWPLASRPEANQMYLDFRRFDSVRALAKEMKTVVAEFDDVSETTIVKESLRTVASLTVVQALYRPLAPAESRAALLTRCSGGIASERITKPHESVYIVLCENHSK